MHAERLEELLRSGPLKTYTRSDLALALKVSKPTIAALVAQLREADVGISESRVRQGKRGPMAIAYALVES
jgi:Mn-dependent DtxR family transcriptional regulator